MNGIDSFSIKVISFLITLAAYGMEIFGAITIILVIIAIILEIYDREQSKHKLNKIKTKKKEYSNINIYNIIDQEFNRKIHRCIWQQNNSINTEYMDRKDAKRREMELHAEVRQKLSEIKEKISNQDNTNTNIDNIKLELTEVFKNILSITALREFIFYDIEDLNNRYRRFIILLIYTKLITDNQNLDKKTQEAIETEKEEIIAIETINYIYNRNSSYSYNTSTFINTVEEFSELAKNIFRDFDELYSMCMPQQEIREEPTNNADQEPSEETNKTEEQEVVNKYRVII
jgi:ABC-type multidrug transport system fused ATPase/permease subunit